MGFDTVAGANLQRAFARPPAVDMHAAEIEHLAPLTATQSSHVTDQKAVQAHAGIWRIGHQAMDAGHGVCGISGYHASAHVYRLTCHIGLIT